MNCLYCQSKLPKDASPKAKFCCDSHKVMFHRKGAKNGTVTTVNEPKKPLKLAKQLPKFPEGMGYSYQSTVQLPSDCNIRFTGMGEKTPPVPKVPKVILPPDSDLREVVGPKAGKGWRGPRQLVGGEMTSERLMRLKAYRDWAQKQGLTHLVLTRSDLENLLKQAGAKLSLADKVFSAPAVQLTEPILNPEEEDEL